MKKAVLWTMAALLVLFAVVYPLRDVIRAGRNAQKLKAAVTHVEGAAAALNALVPFPWDAVYTFEPYTSRADIEAALGTRSRLIRETTSEGMTQLLFVKGGGLVCSVCDSPEKLGYAIDFDGCIAYDEGAVFDVVREGGVVRLQLREQATGNRE